LPEKALFAKLIFGALADCAGDHAGASVIMSSRLSTDTAARRLFHAVYIISIRFFTKYPDVEAEQGDLKTRERRTINWEV
jgi:hypothetical protein